MLIKQYRWALQSDGEYGNLPLHYSVYGYKIDNDVHVPSIGLVRCLLDKYPEAASKVNDYGELPLHLACLNWLCSIDVIDAPVQP